MADTDSPAHPWVADGPRRSRFGVETIPLPDRAATRDFAQTAEGPGFDSFWLPDHPPAKGNATCTTLAAIAAATQNCRSGAD
jgi:alkanesulfonate monooxygenase SsuD/methylene tetrahydromethanopterin reductase-like flavin-dependent oxidoreductase (luciferase family)